jgi:hypothetical protein
MRRLGGGTEASRDGGEEAGGEGGERPRMPRLASYPGSPGPMNLSLEATPAELALVFPTILER